MEKENTNNSQLLFRIAFISTILMLIIIPLQIIVYSVTKIPDNTLAWFELFRSSTILGMFHSDFFILVNNILISIIYLAFYHTLKDTDKGLIQIGILLGLIGIAAYISSNKTFELMSLSGRYFLETDIDMKQMILSAGMASLAGWQGTAFDTYYVLNGIALFIVSGLMFKSGIYNRVTACFGLCAAVFMIIPSTAGTLGLIFSLLSLIPWYVFSIMYSIVFHKIYKQKKDKIV